MEKIKIEIEAINQEAQKKRLELYEERFDQLLGQKEKTDKSK